ncbi:MAG: hypothetical protein AAF559_09325 [Pseudomonadota bacterium]
MAALATIGALGACDFRPTERCDGTGRLNLGVNGYVFHVKDREISSISFWNRLQPPAIVKPWGTSRNCRSDRYGKGPVEVQSFSAYVGGPNGLLLNFQSPPAKFYEERASFTPVETAQIKAIEVGEPEDDGGLSLMLPLEFHLRDGTIRQWSTNCFAPLRDDPDTVHVGRCRVLLPLRGGPWLMIQTAGAKPDEPERIRQLERNIVVGLSFAEQLQEQSERANRYEWE